MLCNLIFLNIDIYTKKVFIGIAIGKNIIMSSSFVLNDIFMKMGTILTHIYKKVNYAMITCSKIYPYQIDILTTSLNHKWSSIPPTAAVQCFIIVPCTPIHLVMVPCTDRIQALKSPSDNFLKWKTMYHAQIVVTAKPLRYVCYQKIYEGNLFYAILQSNDTTD